MKLTNNVIKKQVRQFIAGLDIHFTFSFGERDADLVFILPGEDGKTDRFSGVVVDLSESSPDTAFTVIIQVITEKILLSDTP